jgi:hypothetical protein
LCGDAVGVPASLLVVLRQEFGESMYVPLGWPFGNWLVKKPFRELVFARIDPGRQVVQSLQIPNPLAGLEKVGRCDVGAGDCGVEIPIIIGLHRK